MRRSPPKIHQTDPQAAQTARKLLQTERLRPQSDLKRQRRCSRRRCSDFPIQETDVAHCHHAAKWIRPERVRSSAPDGNYAHFREEGS